MASGPILWSAIPVLHIHGASRLPGRGHPDTRPLLLLPAGALKWWEDQTDTHLSHRHQVQTTVHRLGDRTFWVFSLGHVIPPSLPPGVALRSGTADRADNSSPLAYWGSGTRSERAVFETTPLSPPEEEKGPATRNEGMLLFWRPSSASVRSQSSEQLGKKKLAIRDSTSKMGATLPSLPYLETARQRKRKRKHMEQQ